MLEGDTYLVRQLRSRPQRRLAGLHSRPSAHRPGLVRALLPEHSMTVVLLDDRDSSPADADSPGEVTLTTACRGHRGPRAGPRSAWRSCAGCCRATAPSFTTVWPPSPPTPSLTVSTCFRAGRRWPSRVWNWRAAPRLVSHRSVCERTTGRTGTPASGSTPTLSSRHCCAGTSLSQPARCAAVQAPPRSLPWTISSPTLAGRMPLARMRPSRALDAHLLPGHR